MPVRATKRGAARVPFPTGADADVLICGASFAGLTVARELRSTGARVLVLDRYEIGERQTSACAAPTEWLRNLGLEASIRQTFDSLLVHTPAVERARWPLPWTFSTFDYRQLCDLLWEQSGEAEFETAKVESRTGNTVRTDRGDVTRAADRRCTRLATGARAGGQLPAARRRRCRAAWRSIRRASATTSSCGSTRATSTPATAGRSPRATSCASASAPSTRTTRSSSRRCGCVEDVDAEPHGYQGNWIPHRIRPATEDGVFFAGDSAGPLPAADRRGHPDGVLLRDRARARAARRARGPPGPRRGAAALPRLQRRRTAGSTRRSTSPSSRSGTCTAARWTR